MKDLQTALEQAAHHVEQEALFKHAQLRSRAENDRVLALLLKAQDIVRQMMLAEPVAHGFAPNGKITDVLVVGRNDDPEYNIPLFTHAAPQAVPAETQPTHKTTGWMAHRDQYAVPVLFNPYTGEPRDVRDVQSDPQGMLIVPPGKVEMLAAAPKGAV